MSKQPAVYILASKRNGTLYIGVTSDLKKRAWEHKNDYMDGSSKKYGVHDVVYYELHQNMVSAAIREKQIIELWKSWIQKSRDSSPQRSGVGTSLPHCLLWKRFASW